MLTPQELLKPRWLVINTYPGSNLPVGHIIERNFSMGLLQKQTLDKYANIFKKLEWYQERKKEDLPLYVRCIEGCSVPTSGSSYKLFHEGSLYKNEFPCPLSIMEPATEEEYLNYINKH